MIFLQQTDIAATIELSTSLYFEGETTVKYLEESYNIRNQSSQILLNVCMWKGGEVYSHTYV